MSLYEDLNEVLTPYANKIKEVFTFLNTLNEGGLILKDDVIAQGIIAWLEEHPEATTTVLDGSLTEAKLSDELKEKVVHNYVTPQMYGAKADGITDDTTAIQNTLNYLNTKGGGIIYFPVGTYLINSSVQSHTNIIMIGEGNGSVIKIGVSEISLITANDNVVKNLGFDGNATMLSGGIPEHNIILSARGSNIIVKDCYFSDAIGSCIGSSNGNNVKLLHNTMNGYGDHAVYFSTNSSNIIVSQNIISRPNADRGHEAIKFREGVNNVCVANNIGENVPCFIMISAQNSACKNVVVINNHATTTSHAAIISSEILGLYNENVLISNNVFENIDRYVALTLIRNSKPGCRNVIISNNVFDNYNGLGAIQGVADYPIENISVINNIFNFNENSTGIAIVLSNAKNLRYIGNTFFVPNAMSTFISTLEGSECEFNGNYFNLECTWLFNFVNRSNIKIMFTGNTVKKLTRRLINNGNITGNSLIVIKGNNILDDNTGYPYFYDRSSVSDPTKYLIKDNVVNGAEYNPSMITYIPSYVGQMCVNNGVVYVAVGTTATTDWIALNTTA